MLYLSLKSLHVIAIIAWMAGMLYLPRLFVYHCDAPAGSAQSETFKIMERRLLKAIINPAMIVSFVLGIYLGWDAGFWSESWLQLKFLLVIGLSATHGVLVRRQKEFARDANTRPARYYRILNEVPTVLMIGIVFLVIMKPNLW